MEQTIEQLNKIALLADLETRYGGVMGQAIYDQLTRVHRESLQEPDCLEVLQLSEIAHRLRAHVRDLIQQYRTNENISKTWPQNVVALFDGAGTKGEIFRAYRLYKKMNREFHALYDVCMPMTDRQEPHCVRRWYDARVSNDRAGATYMN
jgi:hypothetical protein